MLKKILLFGVICSSILLYISGCKNNYETIKIGVVGTMTGINSDLSISGRRGVELAVSEYNKAGGFNGRIVELVIKDDLDEPAIALKVDQELIEEKIPIVIGHFTSGMMIKSMDYLRNKDILFLSPTVSADSMLGIDDNFIRFIATTKEQANVLAEMALINKDQTFAIIYGLSNHGFNDALYTNFKERLRNNKGAVVLTQTYTSNNELDYATLAKTINELKADAIFIIADSVDNAQITQQIRKNGCDVQIYSPLWSNTPDLIKKGGSAVDGMYIVGAIDQNNQAEDFVNFKQKYQETYGDAPSFASVYSYEAATALFQAMEIGPNLMPSTIKTNIIKLKDFHGLQENYQINEFGDNNRSYKIFRIVNGELRMVD